MRSSIALLVLITALSQGSFGRTIHSALNALSRRSSPIADPAPGYVAWFKADAIAGLNDGDPVGAWDDSGPNNKDAAQSTASFKPTYRTNIIASKPVVRFDGIDDRLVSPAGAGMWGLTNHFTVFAVVRLDLSPGTTGQDVVGSNNLSNNLDLMARRDDANGNWLAYHSSPDGTHNADLVLSTGSWHVVTWRLKANSPKHVQIRVDKVYSLNYTGYTGIGTAPSSAAIGARQNGANPFKGDIAEVIFYSESLSDADMTATEDYLLEKYGLAEGVCPPEQIYGSAFVSKFLTQDRWSDERAEVGLSSVDPSELRLLEDPLDSATCLALTEDLEGYDLLDPSPQWKATYWQIENRFIADINPTAISGADTIHTGWASMAVYDDSLSRLEIYLH